MGNAATLRFVQPRVPLEQVLRGQPACRAGVKSRLRRRSVIANARNACRPRSVSALPAKAASTAASTTHAAASHHTALRCTAMHRNAPLCDACVAHGAWHCCCHCRRSSQQAAARSASITARAWRGDMSRGRPATLPHSKRARRGTTILAFQDKGLCLVASAQVNTHVLRRIWSALALATGLDHPRPAVPRLCGLCPDDRP